MTTRSFYEIHFTGEGFRTLGVYRLFFKCALEKVRAHQAEYEAQVAEWYREHPGYQFPHCIHGSSLTTDYDNICGGCESGDSPIELAIQHARERFLRFLDRWEWVNQAPGDLAYDTRCELLEWAYSCFPYNARNGG